MGNMRHCQRYIVTGSGWIYRSNDQKAEFKVNDISASGVNITSNSVLKEKDIILMEIYVYGNLLPFTKKAKGEVVRKQQGMGYRYSIRFVGLTDKDMIEMDEYLRLNCGGTDLHYTPYEVIYDDFIE